MPQLLTLFSSTDRTSSNKGFGELGCRADVEGHDITGGLAAGATVCAVVTTHDASEMRDAHFITPTLRDLQELLLG